MIVLLKLKDVSKLTLMSKSSIYLKIKEGTFPSQVKQGRRAIAFLAIEIEQWLLAISQEKTDSELKELIQYLTKKRTRTFEI